MRIQIFKDTLKFVESGYTIDDKQIVIDSKCIISEYFDEPEKLHKHTTNEAKISIINSDCLEDAIHRLPDKRRSLLQLQYLPQPYMGIETVREKLFVAEYFPYFSNHFGDVQNIRVPSQKYTFHLIRKAMKDGKIIVIMRAETKWREEIPELKTPNVS